MRKIGWILSCAFLPFMGCDGDSSEGATGGVDNPITSPSLDTSREVSSTDTGPEEVLTDVESGEEGEDAFVAGGDGESGDTSPGDGLVADASGEDAGESTGVVEDVSTAQDDTAVVEEEDTLPEPDVAVGEPDVETGGKELSELDLNGTIPLTALSVPTFLAENSDGGSRTEADLLGKPTVMWFFPFAGTPG